MFLLALLACVSDIDKGNIDPYCESICDELVYNCSFAAFPTHESCIEGCLYSAEKGGDNEQYSVCVQEAECDIFKVVECENANGMNFEN